MEISLIDLNFSYKREILTLLSELLLNLLFIKIITQNNPYSKEAYFGAVCCFVLFIFIYLFVYFKVCSGTSCELRALHLHSHLSHASKPFCSGYF
jgi:hypothetical protein